VRPRSAALILAAVGLAMTLAGCGIFGVKGPGLDKGTPSSLDPRCTQPPFELPSFCPLAGIGADTQTFDDSHLYVGKTQVIPGNTNYLQVKVVMGRVVSFLEQFHVAPPLSDREARLVSHGEVPSDGKKLFTKNVAGMCQVTEYRSARLRQQYGKQFSAVLIVLRSADPSNFDKTSVTTANISLGAPHSAAAVTSC
jgi:hypothetical protein